jgi:ethylbenzene dioxygenase beta subunit
MTEADIEMSSVIIHHEISQMLYREARLLDEERYTEWLSLFTEDVHYWVPGISNRARRDSEGTFERARMAFFDDNMQDLSRRVARYNQPTAWSEDPSTRHLHLVSNIEVAAAVGDEGAPQDEAEPAPGANEYVVHSVLLNYRNRNHDEEDVLTARRRDIVRKTAFGLQIARRRVLLGHSLLLTKNINTFL